MIQSRRDFLRTTSLVGFASLAGVASLKEAFAQSFSGTVTRRRKNVLFIAVDDLRPELGCYGHPMVKSPNIDALASQGLLFERTYCQQAICGPTRASLLTGKRPDTTGIYDLKTHIRTTMPDVVTLQQHFKNNGYTSIGVGKLFHVGMEDPASYSVPHNNGNGSAYALEENLKLLKEGGKTTKDGAAEDGSPASTRMRANATECADVPDDVYLDGNIAQLALESLQQLALKATASKDGQLFFLGVGFRKPHLPFCAPKKYWDLYDRSKISMPYSEKPKDAPDIAFTTWGELRSYSDIPDVGPCDEAKTKELIHGYYACVSFTDALVGKLLAELDRLDLRKDTIVILWGDHGWKLGEYSAWSKHTNFELDTRVPMILSDPDAPKGIRTKALTEFVDIYPTLSDLCGLPVAKDLEGVSMVPLLEDPKRPWKKAAFSQYPRPKKMMGYSMRTERYRYTEWIDQQTNEVKYRELYDMTNDLLCKENIAFKPKNAALAASMHEMMKAGWQGAKPW